MSALSHPVYVSITGLRLKRSWHLFRFYHHASRCFKQAKAADGNLLAEVKTIDGVHHTLTVWQSREAMLDFVHSGAHREAIKAFGAIAYGKTFGYETDTVPTWDAVHRLWLVHGLDYDAAA